MTRRQLHKPTCCWRPAIGFAAAYSILIGATVVGVAYAECIFHGRATSAIRHLPAVLSSLAVLLGVVSQTLTRTDKRGGSSSAGRLADNGKRRIRARAYRSGPWRRALIPRR
jgi:hypothetical protein